MNVKLLLKKCVVIACLVSSGLQAAGPSAFELLMAKKTGLNVKLRGVCFQVDGSAQRASQTELTEVSDGLAAVRAEVSEVRNELRVLGHESQVTTEAPEGMTPMGSPVASYPLVGLLFYEFDSAELERVAAPADALATALAELHARNADVLACKARLDVARNNLDELMGRCHGQLTYEAIETTIKTAQNRIEVAQRVRTAASLRVAQLRLQLQTTMMSRVAEARGIKRGRPVVTAPAPVPQLRRSGCVIARRPALQLKRT